MTLVSEFDFVLPESLIAQEPRRRGESRLLVVDRATGRLSEHRFDELPGLLAAGDLLVANDTRVFPARLIGRRDPSGGVAECMLLKRVGVSEWEALVHPGQKLKAGARLLFEDSVRAPGLRLRAEVLERRFFGRRVIRLEAEGIDVEAAIDRLGHVPLPPYIHRGDRPDDRDRYQTVYARARGSVAAPTAGLHFDASLIDRLSAAGIGWTTITLHVGYGTFQPVRADRVEDHRVDPEAFEITPEAAEAIAATRRTRRRVVAVGTTTTRALESAAIVPAHSTIAAGGLVRAGRGETDLFIHPGYTFRVVDALVTNFHLPRSSLLMLVSAFAGVALTRGAYAYAIEREFRFYSYGDAMLIL